MAITEGTSTYRLCGSSTDQERTCKEWGNGSSILSLFTVTAGCVSVKGRINARIRLTLST